MDIVINAWGVIGAAVAAMVVGSIWYAEPVMGKQWMKLVGLNKKKAQKEAPKAMLGAGLGAFASSFVLAHITYLTFSFFDYTYQAAALVTALYVWAGFQLSMTVMNSMFEQRPTKLMYINLGNGFITIVVQALVLGWIGI